MASALEPYECAIESRLPPEDISRRRLQAALRNAAARPPVRRARPARSAGYAALAVTSSIAFAYAALMLHRERPQSPFTAEWVLAEATATEFRSENLIAKPGVFFERVEVRGRGLHIEWPVYRDAEHMRRPRFKTVADPEKKLQQRLALAGITRENPLSAGSFKQWRDGLGPHSESILSSSSGLIVIATSVPPGTSSLVREETLTVRSLDFHPVARTVFFVDDEVVELAEVDYKFLDWKQADRDWFEDDKGTRTPSLRAVETPPLLPHALPESQLILAELQARLALSHGDADTNEQIEIARRPNGVLVRGLAGSAESKARLETLLNSIPHVIATISTPAELDQSESRDSAAQPNAIQLISTVSRPSPLLVFLRDRGRSLQEAAAASTQLRNAALSMRQQAHALSELAREFPIDGSLDESCRAVLNALIRDHMDKLRAATALEAGVLVSIDPASGQREASSWARGSAAASSDSVGGFADLDRIASRSFELCRELTSGDSSDPRPASAILSDLSLQPAALLRAADSIPAGVPAPMSSSSAHAPVNLQ